MPRSAETTCSAHSRMDQRSDEGFNRASSSLTPATARRKSSRVRSRTESIIWRSCSSIAPKNNMGIEALEPYGSCAWDGKQEGDAKCHRAGKTLVHSSTTDGRSGNPERLADFADLRGVAGRVHRQNRQTFLRGDYPGDGMRHFHGVEIIAAFGDEL